MSIVAYLLLGAVLGVVAFLLTRFVPMPGTFVRAIPVVALLIWLLIGLVLIMGGGLGSLWSIQMPRIK